MDGGSVSRQKSGTRRSSARLNGSAAATSAGSSGAKGLGAASAARSAAAARRRAAERQRAAERAREVEDSPRELRRKCRRLARALRHAKHLVVYTGAGMSTAASIPDYRGPRGVWTLLRRGERVACDVAAAAPTFAHMALTALWRRGLVKFVVSQNCDGLHVRAGLPRAALAELHGDMFAERCAACRRVYLRAFDTTRRTARHAHGTRRLCHACGAELSDTIVHFGERGSAAWPLNWAGALRHAAAADVVLCLGSSLKVLRRYPRLWSMHRPPRHRPRLYIVNLQWTPKDAAAALKINARCDAVMAQLARRLRVRVPRYRPSRDPLLAHAEPLLAAERHTAPRPLRPPSEPSDSSSDPPSDDDDEDLLPLRRLAERLRRAQPRAPPAPIAPIAPIAPTASPAPTAPTAPHAEPLQLNGNHIKQNGLCSFQVNLSCEGAAAKATILLRLQHTAERQAQELQREAGAAVRRAALLWRAWWWGAWGGGGLAAVARGACAWCWSQQRAPRCLWYGAPRATPPERRAGPRRLCACCAPAAPAAAAAAAAAEPDAPQPGWFGKGCRKGRR